MKLRWPFSFLLLLAFCLSLLNATLLSSLLHAKTPVELDQVIDSFKVTDELEDKLNLAYRGLDLYAPLRNKAATIDPDDRNSLSEMKRLMIVDLVRREEVPVIISAIGSTGNWLIRPGKIKNDFDAAKENETARFKRDGFYMEGLSDLDFTVMGSQARDYVQKLSAILAAGRNGHNLTPHELKQLEINFLVDEQISDISSGGNNRKFWRQMLDLKSSSFHPEKYISKGGKALYCVEHLGARGAALKPAMNPQAMPFQTWLRSASQKIGPFTMEHLYGGSCDMDYFISHAFKEDQDELKTVLQGIKYLERQAWMLEQANANADQLPDGLVFRSKHAEGLVEKARAIREFCDRAVDQDMWRTERAFRGFKKETLEKSADTCMSAHFLSIALGYELLWRLDTDDLTVRQAVVLDGIAYDLKTVHEERYAYGRPDWYESHQTTIVKETVDFLAAYENRKRQKNVHKLLAKAGILKPKDEMLTTIEMGPIPPPPVASIELGPILTMDPNKPKVGDEVTFTLKVKLHELIEEMPDWEKAWESKEQKAAMEQVAVWSWLVAVRRMEMSHLLKTDAENKQKEGDAFVYVSPYEIEEIAEELKICEDEVAQKSKELGLNPPKLETGRFKPHLKPQPTLGAVDEYMKALKKSAMESRHILTAITSETHGIISLAENDASYKSFSPGVKERIAALRDIHTMANDKVVKIDHLLEKYVLFAGYAESLKKIGNQDFWEAAKKAKELEAYLEMLTDQTQTSVYGAAALYNSLDRTLKEFFARSHFGDRYGEHAELFASMRTRMLGWARHRRQLRAHDIPELQERAKWLSRGAWAATTAKWTLRLVAVINDYMKVEKSLSATDLSGETMKAVRALKTVGSIISGFADTIPIPVLSQAIKDYMDIFSKAPQWSKAFDEMMRYRYQSRGYDVRSVLLPAAYKELIRHDSKLEAGQFYRFNGPFGKYNTKLIVFGHPTPDPLETEEKNIRGQERYINFRRDQLWLVWDKTNENGFIKLDADAFRKASLYSSWFRRIEDRHILGTELHDFLTKGKYEGGYFDFLTKDEVVGGTFVGNDMTVDQLRFGAENIRRISAVKDYLGTITGRTSFSPDEVRHFYAMLDRTARRLARAGFIMTNYDVEEIMKQLRPQRDTTSSWKTLLKVIPYKSGIIHDAVKEGVSISDSLDFVKKGAEIYDSLPGVEKNRLDTLISEQIKKKRTLRSEGREEFWRNKQRGTPAGLQLKDISINVTHNLKNKDFEITDTDFIRPQSDEFTITWTETLSDTMTEECSYACNVSISGYKDSGDESFHMFWVHEEPEDPGVNIEVVGVQSGWELHDEGKERFYWWQGERVGPYISWHTEKRQQVQYKTAYDENGKEHGRGTYFDDDGILRSEGTYVHGKEEGRHVKYWRDDKGISEIRIYKNGKLDGLQQDWHRYTSPFPGDDTRYLEKQVRYENGIRTGTSREWRREGTLLCEETFDSEGNVKTRISYHAFGGLRELIRYQDNKEISKTVYDYEGRKVTDEENK